MHLPHVLQRLLPCAIDSIPIVQAIDDETLEAVARSDDALAELRSSVLGLAAAVVMPAPCVNLPRATARNVPSCAIIRLESGPIWIVKVLGYWWSTQRLVTAGRVLQECGNAFEPAALNDRLCDELELPGVSASRPGPADFDGSGWDVRRVAVAIHLARAFGEGLAKAATLNSAELNAVVERTGEHLTQVLRRFQSGLDSEAMYFAVRSGCVSPHIYNYLADTEHRRNRLQLAKVLPVFLHSLVFRADISPYRQMRLAVDQGLPLVDVASKAMRVSPSAMRCVIGRDLSICGEAWEGTPDTLVQLIDSIRPEARPGTNPETWKRLRALVDFAEQQTGRRIAESFFGRAWVREATQAGIRAVPHGAEPIFDGRSVAAVESLREELLLVLQVDKRTADGKRSALEVASIKESVDAMLFTRTLRRLITIGLHWQQEYASARAERDDLMEFFRGARYWPLLPSEHRTADGSRRVVPLANSTQVQEHGVALGTCLAGSHLQAYDVACRKGRAFLLAVVDGATGRPQSTVELKASRHGKSAAIIVTVVQHTGRANSAPSEACKQALRELLALISSEPVQRHLRLGLLAMGTFRERFTEPGGRAELLAKVRAFRRTLGDETYQLLLGASIASPLVG